MLTTVYAQSLPHAISDASSDSVSESALWEDLMKQMITVCYRTVVELPEWASKRQVVNSHLFYTTRKLREKAIVEVSASTLDVYVQSQLRVALILPADS